ncbi:hypothetical protein D3C74_177550 [compost metagenome]
MTTNVEQGSIRISNKAIAKIASMSILEVKEVTALVDGKMKRNDKSKCYKAVEVRIKESEITIDFCPIVRLGTPLHQLSRTLQNNIKKAVEEMTGLIVLSVNITIVGLHYED